MQTSFNFELCWLCYAIPGLFLASVSAFNLKEAGKPSLIVGPLEILPSPTYFISRHAAYPFIVISTVLQVFSLRLVILPQTAPFYS